MASGFCKGATYEGHSVGTVVALCQCMRTKHKNGVSSKRSARAAARKTRSKMTMMSALPGRTKRFVKSNPVRLLLGAAALGVVVAKLKNFI